MEHNVYIDSIPVPAGIKIKTTNGWAPLVSVNHTEPVDTTICIKTELGKELHCSKNHLLFVNENDTIEASKSLQHKVKTTDGYEYVTEIKNGSTEELYDVTVDDDRHEYQTNKIASHNCVCIDEGAFIPHLDDVLQAISPTLSRDPDAELIFTTTPAGKNGQFFDLYQTALNDDKWLVQTTTIFDAIKDGLVVDVDSLKSLCPDPDVFDQEYCCKFLSDYGSLIDVSLLQYAEPVGNSYYCGIDLGRHHDRTAITIIRQKSGSFYLDNIVTLDKVEYSRQLDIIKQLNDKYHFVAGYTDRGGLGDPMAEWIQRNINARVKGWAFTATSKTPAYEYLRSLIFERKLFFKEDFKTQIETDFQNVSRIVTESGQVKFEAGRDANGHSDITSSLVLALQAAHDNPENIRCPISFPGGSAFGSWRSIL